MNHFGDVTEKEMTQYKGLLNDSQKDDHAKPFTAPIVRHASHIIPISLDWRDYGKCTATAHITPVKNTLAAAFFFYYFL